MTDPSLPAWRLIRVRPRLEAKVAAELVAQDIGAYSPHEDEQVTRYKQGRGRPGHLVNQRSCLLPGYVFVRASVGDLDDIRALDDVFVSRGEQLARILSPKDVQIVLGLMAAEGAGLFDHRPQAPQTLLAGDIVRVLLGDGDSVVARVARAQTTTRRVKVLMDWLGGEREVDVALDRVNRLCA